MPVQSGPSAAVSSLPTSVHVDLSLLNGKLADDGGSICCVNCLVTSEGSSVQAGRRGTRNRLNINHRKPIKRCFKPAILSFSSPSSIQSFHYSYHLTPNFISLKLQNEDFCCSFHPDGGWPCVCCSPEQPPYVYHDRLFSRHYQDSHLLTSF